MFNESNYYPQLVCENQFMRDLVAVVMTIGWSLKSNVKKVIEEIEPFLVQNKKNTRTSLIL